MGNKKETFEPEVQIENAIVKTESYIERNIKKIITITLAATVLALGIFGYTNLVKAPLQTEASEAIFVAQQQFANDNYELALNGDGSNLGFLDIAQEFSSTHTGNIANQYAGICYLRLNDLDNAMASLTAYKNVNNEAGAVINAQNAGLIGDVFSQKKEYSSAAKKYSEAVKLSDNSLTAPMYLKKAGLVYETMGDKAKALASYEVIKTKYFGSMEARDIEKYISRLK